MANFKLRYSPLFYEDLDKITDYILLKLKNEQAAKEQINNVETSIKKLAGNPHSAPTYKSISNRENIYRKLKIGNYLIFFVVKDDKVIVRRMLYGRRDLDKIL